MTHKPKSPTESDELKQSIDGLLSEAKERLGDFENELRNHHTRVTDFIREYPLTSAAGAFAAGYFLSKLFRKERIVYVKK